MSRRSPDVVHTGVNIGPASSSRGDTVLASVDPQWRHGAAQGHSGTHMVHGALRQVLGPNAVQAGSLNRSRATCFDFNWQGALTEDQRSQIEEVANEAVGADYLVNTFTTGIEKAKAMGAMALFGEQYPDEVPWVEIGGPFTRTVRRHTRAQLSPDRTGHHSRRVLGRLRGAAGRGLRRLGLVPAPGQGARTDGGPGVLAQGALRGGARPGCHPGGAAPGR